MTEADRCPTDELLIAYVSEDLGDAEELRIDAHLDMCDRCLENLCVVHDRLQATVADLHPTPIAVIERARTVWDERPLHDEDEDEPPRQRPAPRAAVPLLLRLPLLVPMSLAAGALLVVATQTWLTPGTPPTLVRSVHIQQVTQEALVRSQPRLQAVVVATLPPGEMVEVRGTQPGWHRIALPDGSDGWIEQRSLE